MRQELFYECVSTIMSLIIIISLVPWLHVIELGVASRDEVGSGWSSGRLGLRLDDYVRLCVCQCMHVL